MWSPVCLSFLTYIFFIFLYSSLCVSLFFFTFLFPLSYISPSLLLLFPPPLSYLHFFSIPSSFFLLYLRSVISNSSIITLCPSLYVNVSLYHTSHSYRENIFMFIFLSYVAYFMITFSFPSTSPMFHFKVSRPPEILTKDGITRYNKTMNKLS